MTRCTSRLPNLMIALRGIGATVGGFIMTPEDYALNTPRNLTLKPEYCQLPFKIHNETEDVPNYITLGSIFLRNYYSTFSEDNKSIIRKSKSLFLA